VKILCRAQPHIVRQQNFRAQKKDVDGMWKKISKITQVNIARGEQLEGKSFNTKLSRTLALHLTVRGPIVSLCNVLHKWTKGEC
jgi:hypothetical protein